MPGGTVNEDGRRDCSAARIVAIQIGSALFAPLSRRPRGLRSSKPTHTPATVVGREADEPRIARVVARAGLARERSTERACGDGGALLDDAREHARDEIGLGRRHRLRRGRGSGTAIARRRDRRLATGCACPRIGRPPRRSRTRSRARRASPRSRRARATGHHQIGRDAERARERDDARPRDLLAAASTATGLIERESATRRRTGIERRPRCPGRGAPRRRRRSAPGS